MLHDHKEHGVKHDSKGSRFQRRKKEPGSAAEKAVSNGVKDDIYGSPGKEEVSARSG